MSGCGPERGKKGACAQHELLAGLLDSTSLVVYLKDLEGRYCFVNRRYETLSAVPREAILGKRDRDFFPPEVAGLFRAQDAQVVSSGASMEFEETIPLPGGEYSFLTEKFPLFDEKGTVRAVGGFCTEITPQKKRAEREMRWKTSLLEAQLNATNDGVLIVDENGKTVLQNRRCVELFDIPAPLVAARDDKAQLEFVSGRVKDPEKFLGRVEHLYSHPEETSSDEVEFKDGTILDRHSAPVIAADGAYLGRIWTFHDVTGIRRREQEHLRMQKLDSLGILAGGIAHDFNNILTAIQGNLSLLRSELKAGSESLEMIQDAQEACESAKGLSQQLLTFSRGGSPVIKTTNLPPLLRQAAVFAARGSKSRCRFDLGEGPLAARVDRDQVVQVIQNLVINAAQAMPSGGSINVSAEAVHLVEDGARKLAAGPYVKVTVEDQGIGIPPSHLTKVFDPYFSTKDAGRGLGLSVCYSIMAKHGGHIGVASVPGQGTVFTLYFPAASAADLEARLDQPAITPGSGKVLVMDDEAVVTKVLKRMLARLGYRASVVRDGRAALAAYKKALKAKKPYDAVILDLVIPGGMGGAEAMSRLAAIDPKAKGIVSSGYSNDPVIANYAAAGFRGVLSKPYRLEAVSEALRLVLGAKRR